MKAIETIKAAFDGITQDAQEGNTDALQAYAYLKQVEKAFKDCLSAVQELAQEDADKHPKSFEHAGFKFEKRAGGKVWNFKNIPAWADAKADLTDIEAQAKLAFAAYEKGQNMVSEDGEIHDLPEVTYKKDSLIIKPF